MAFAENLAALASADHLARIELTGSGGEAAVIENRPGSQGSLKVYHHLILKHGDIGPAAAREGLRLFAEHTEDARENPGRHPNIDRLLQVVEGGVRYLGRLIPA